MKIELPQIETDEHGSPYSVSHDDIYFHPESGLDETRHVFLNSNDLPNRFAQMQPGQTFVIGELGFGTGLNVLAACQLFEEVAPKGCRLHVVSIEGYPMAGAKMDAYLAGFESLDRWRRALRLDCLLRVPGVHRLHVGPRCELSLILGQVQEAFEDWPQFDCVGRKTNSSGNSEAGVDAWFLDGFAPSRNQAMWSEQVLKQVGEKTKKGGTFATFTSAGFVRRNLQAAGFEVKKVLGFGGKREMAVGVKLGFAIDEIRDEAISDDESGADTAAAIKDGAVVNVGGGGGGAVSGARVVVVGAGFAGAAVAEACKRRGYSVLVLEQERLAAGASGNPQAVFEPVLNLEDSPRRRFFDSAFAYARRRLEQMDLLHQTGVRRPALDDKQHQRHQRLVTSSGWLDGKPVLDVDTSNQRAMVLPAAGWVEPVQVCEKLLEEIELHTGAKVYGMERIESEGCGGGCDGGGGGGGGWRVFYRKKQANGESVVTSIDTDAVVMANASDAAKVGVFNDWPLQPVRGQLTCPRATPASQAMQQVLCGKGYALPEMRGRHTLGATFDPDDLEPKIRQADHEHIQAQVKQMAADWMQTLDWSDVRGRVSWRCSTSDRMPMIGPVPDLKACQELLGRCWPEHCFDAPVMPGLYATVGHGSRGLLSALVGGELIADWMDRSPFAVGRQAVEAVTPARFLWRQVKKHQRVCYVDEGV